MGASYAGGRRIDALDVNRQEQVFRVLIPDARRGALSLSRRRFEDDAGKDTTLIWCTSTPSLSAWLAAGI
jgi:hypothetical protein